MAGGKALQTIVKEAVKGTGIGLGVGVAWIYGVAKPNENTIKAYYKDLNEQEAKMRASGGN
eukprot:CAMPEP_0113297130 /NCGR_PEP_ID=MMETSP0010_2-20120614/119_1 /TAXON_ID=216773 ORGANISM="Corethron hystrix, Strain 308" /NCGR_SAMPLE_ID=MMETSP0010_2 /ASSEMBLY_ACC=CAM_ASM_000155 /LENGTH=60 /DNA_ID=CAMNT_0000149965 /DNA_START=90 /DNA_END=272 /DNA_ORIENTATION=- /assembly_acc=CAM_ASM_000155